GVRAAVDLDHDVIEAGGEVSGDLQRLLHRDVVGVRLLDDIAVLVEDVDLDVRGDAARGEVRLVEFEGDAAGLVDVDAEFGRRGGARGIEVHVRPGPERSHRG